MQRGRDERRARPWEEDGEIVRLGRRRTECSDVQDLIVETAQRAAMTDADDGWPPWGGTQQAVEPGFADLVQGRGGLVQKKQGRFDEQNPGKSQPLLFAQR